MRQRRLPADRRVLLAAGAADGRGRRAVRAAQPPRADRDRVRARWLPAVSQPRPGGAGAGGGEVARGGCIGRARGVVLAWEGAMEREASRDDAAVPMAEADTSGAEYLAGDDRTKAHGYNHLPHRPRKPDQRRQAEEARHISTTRATHADDEGAGEGPF